MAAHQWHKRHGEEPCEACRAAYLDYFRERARTEGERHRRAAEQTLARRFPPLTPRVLAVLSAHKKGELILG